MLLLSSKNVNEINDVRLSFVTDVEMATDEVRYL